ncbi:iron-containing alcohol dehydrogenase [Thalassotalea sp. Y01]|uniref:iron-containing alcohol dehydrogenase n=1 Tax=Thalassotalea sp. Y01 TaxID=2729613 RepID=UPI00145F4F37|nr:iron-containing alcohol dehydrogenase [Thalassotalea sp. Y01]NMP15477.1 iron-containing alcohol dehydrogenase [Thalassotalea sp. Y01]
MKAFVFETTKSIVSEIGAIKHIATICNKLNIEKPLIVTDQGIVDCGLLTSIMSSLNDANISAQIFSDVSADPQDALIERVVEYAQQHAVDGVIGFGGGSSMDTAKLVALLASSDEQLQDIYGIEQIKGERFPLVLIPTTAGTGSEVTPIAIVTTGETTKAGVVSAKLLPDVALLDAELTLKLPAHVTAATGIDAMVHAIEAYTSAIKKNPYSDLLAKQALQLLSENIVEATFNGKNLAARQAMLLGACLAGQAFANAPVAAVHALAYPLGGHFHIPHGLSNSLVLPHVLRFNVSAASELYAQLAPFIDSTICMSQSQQQITHALIDYIAKLIKQLNLPTSLKDLGVKYADLGTLANDAMLQTRLLVNNPKPVNLADAKEIYLLAYKGF